MYFSNTTVLAMTADFLRNTWISTKRDMWMYWWIPDMLIIASQKLHQKFKYFSEMYDLPS